MIVAVDTNCIFPGRVGGIENYTLGLIEALKSPASPADHLIILTREENHALFSRFSDARTDVTLIPRPAGSWADLRNQDAKSTDAALKEFQSRKIDLLHRLAADVIHFPGNTINPLELNLPVVLNLHDLQHRRFPEYFTSEEITNREKWWVASGQRADALIAGSGFIRDDLCNQLGIDRSKIFVTPDVFESAFFHRPSAKQLHELKHRFDLRETFFLYPAAAWPHKNHARLIAAFESSGISWAQLVLTGDAQEKIKPAKNVRLLGRVETPDLVGLYHLATALIFPSLYEAWSIPIMEAMACGCPVASANVTSLPEQVADAGLLFDPTSTAAMAKAMQSLTVDRALRESLVERGRKRVRLFSAENFLRTVAKAYESAIASHRARKAA